MNVAICGPGRAGKDVAADHLVERWGFTYAGTTSVVISQEIARREGTIFEQAHAQRHQRREEWFRVGVELRRDDPAHLARTVLKSGNLCVGVRDRDEIEAVLRECLVDIAIWIDRDVPIDPTLMYGEEMCDVIIQNRGTITDFYRRIDRLAATWGVR